MTIANAAQRFEAANENNTHNRDALLVALNRVQAIIEFHVLCCMLHCFCESV